MPTVRRGAAETTASNRAGHAPRQTDSHTEEGCAERARFRHRGDEQAGLAVAADVRHRVEDVAVADDGVERVLALSYLRNALERMQGAEPQLLDSNLRPPPDRRRHRRLTVDRAVDE